MGNNLFLFFAIGGFWILLLLAFVLIVAILFCKGYAGHFLNYRNIFSVMRPGTREKEEKLVNSSLATFSQIEKAIQNWEQEKLFINSGISMEIVASQLSTNRSYLSQYINRVKNKTFNEWINGLRIDEAKRIMTENEEMTIEEIGEKVGYTDKSYFSKCFVKYAGMTPTKWKGEQSSNAPT